MGLAGCEADPVEPTGWLQFDFPYIDDSAIDLDDGRRVFFTRDVDPNRRLEVKLSFAVR